MTDAWYVLRVETGREEAVCRRLREWDGFDAFNPRCAEVGVRRARLITRYRPLWPSYLFARWPRGDAHAWQRVAGPWGEGPLLGVFGVLGGEEPFEIPQKLVEAWAERATSDGLIVDLEDTIERLRRGYGPGDPVRMVGGPWDGLTGTCQWVDQRGTQVKISVAMMQIAVYVPSVGRGVRVIGAGQSTDPRKRSRKRRRAVSRFYKRLGSAECAAFSEAS